VAERLIARALGAFIVAVLPVATKALESSHPKMAALYSVDGGAGQAPPDASAGLLPDESDLFFGVYSTSIPLAVPPNRGSLTPPVALRYRSRDANGPLGMGWDLEFGSIERNFRRGVRFDGDEYVLRVGRSRIELVKVGDRYQGKTDSEFRQIQQVVAADGRSMWEVVDRRGVRFRYGSGPSTRQDNPIRAKEIFAWMLESATDPNGNSYTIAYDKDQGAIYPREIAYNGNRIVFWKSPNRADVSEDYRRGFKVITRYLLTIVEVRSAAPGGGTDLMAAYELKYDASPQTSRSRLVKLTQFGKDAFIESADRVTGSSLPSRTFSWSDGAAGWTPTTFAPSPRAYRTDNLGLATVDLDGDGRMDVVRSVQQGSEPMIGGAWLGPGFVESPAFELPVPLWAFADSSDAIGWDPGVRFADIDGDGKPDLLLGFRDETGALNSAAWRNAGGGCDGRGCAWVSVPDYRPPAPFAGRDSSALHGFDTGSRLVDLDGNGLPDLVRNWSDSGSTEAGAWINLGRAPGQGSTWGWTPSLSPPVAISGRDAAAPAGWDGGVRFVDVTGDGRAELLWGLDDRGFDGGLSPHLHAWTVNPSGPSWDDAWSFVPPMPFCKRDSVTPGGWDEGVRIVDLNGDGRPDLIQGLYDLDHLQATAYLNAGTTGTYTSSAWVAAPQYNPPKPLYSRYPEMRPGRDVGVRFIDVDGDGRPDLLKNSRKYVIGNYVALNLRPVEDIKGAWVNRESNCSTPGCAWVARDEWIPPHYFSFSAWEYFPPYVNTIYYLDAGVRITDPAGIGRPTLFLYAPDPGLQKDVQGAWATDPITPDLLTTIDNGAGAITSIRYQAASSNPSSGLAFPIQNVSEVSLRDGVNAVPAITTFSYTGGYYHAAEREFRGYQLVSVVGPTGPNGEQLKTEFWFHQGNDVLPDKNDPAASTGYMKGKPYRKRTTSMINSTPKSMVEVVTTYWDSSGPSYFTPPRTVETRQCAVDVRGAEMGCRPSVLVEYADFAASGLPVPGYDWVGNPVRENHYRNVQDAGDDRTIIRTYSTASPNHILDRITSETVYAGAGRQTQLTDGNRIAQTAWYYDGAISNLDECRGSGHTDAPRTGNMTKIVRWLNGAPANPEEWRGYDQTGNLVCVSDPDRNVTTYGYDSSGTFRTSSVNAKKHRTTTTYFGVEAAPADSGLYGQVKSVTDPNGITISYSYDVFGRRTVEAVPRIAQTASTPVFEGLTKTTSYFTGSDAGGLTRIETLRSDGNWSATYLDGIGRTYLVKTRSSSVPGARVLVTATAFNPTGTKRAVSQPFLDSPRPTARFERFEYDALGRETRRTTPGGAVTQNCYDDATGDVTTVDPMGHPRRRTVDAAGRVAAMHQYVGVVLATCSADPGAPYATVLYSYDRLDRLTGATDHFGTPYAQDYDTLGRKIFVSEPDIGTWYYGYTPAGDLLWQKDAKGNRIDLGYDELHRLSLRTYPDGSSDVLTYDDPAVPYSKGRRTAMSDSSGNVVFTYDAIGRPFKTTRTTLGRTAEWSANYDAAGRLIRETYPADSSGGVREAEYSYPDGLLDTVRFGGSEIVKLAGYNALDQVGTYNFANGVVSSREYYEQGNNRVRSIDISGSGTRHLRLEYAYDVAANVTRVAGSDPVRGSYVDVFDYDALGRLIAAYGAVDDIRTGPVVNEYDRVRVHTIASSSDGRVYTHDANGNLITDGSRKLRYDFLNRLVEVTMSGGVTLRFAYDGDGRRVWKGVFNGDALTSATFYFGRLFECTGDVCTRHVFAGDLQTRIASINDNTGVRYYHLDRVDNVRVVTDANGAVSERITYSPFGSERSSGETSWRYVSNERDRESGLYFFGARYYDPGLLGFVTPDPSAPNWHDLASLNRYAYARHNPLRYNDPNGLAPAEAGAVNYPVFFWTPDVSYYPGSGVLYVSVQPRYPGTMDQGSPMLVSGAGSSVDSGGTFVYKEPGFGGVGVSASGGIILGAHASAQVLLDSEGNAALGLSFGVHAGPQAGASASVFAVGAIGVTVKQVQDLDSTPSVSAGWKGTPSVSVGAVIVPQVCGSTEGAPIEAVPVTQIGWGPGLEIGVSIQKDWTVWIPLTGWDEGVLYRDPVESQQPQVPAP
jgi:RHS repeat-associated protein